jgi:phosphoglycerate dehydrogenase-like enzyme
MDIVFFGTNAASFQSGLSDLLDLPHRITCISDAPDAGERAILNAADVVVGVHFQRPLTAQRARLFQLPAAGYDQVDFDALPAQCAICNAFGHERAIAEYVMAALLARHVPLDLADRQLRAGAWNFWAGAGPAALRTELGAQSIGIIGHGHIGKAVAERALAFGMAVHVANRSPVRDARYSATYPLADLHQMLSKVDIVINTLPLTPTTTALIDGAAFGAMRPHSVFLNVGRGGVVDETALYEALLNRTIAGAIIDTWYSYPKDATTPQRPATHAFEDLPNLIMTPHMSGWTHGTIARRTETIAQNITRLAAGQPLVNQLR